MGNVKSEENDENILSHTANCSILYDKQGGSIIQWLDESDCLNERAISFQHDSRCMELWKLIAFIKGYKKLSHFESETREKKTTNQQQQNNGEDVQMNKESDDLLDTFLNDH